MFRGKGSDAATARAKCGRVSVAWRKAREAQQRLNYQLEADSEQPHTRVLAQMERFPGWRSRNPWKDEFEARDVSSDGKRVCIGMGD